MSSHKVSQLHFIERDISVCDCSVDGLEEEKILVLVAAVVSQLINLSASGKASWVKNAIIDDAISETVRPASFVPDVSNHRLRWSGTPSQNCLLPP